MTREAAAEIEVRLREEEPEQFLWKGRLYQVRAVLGRWRQGREGWREEALPSRPGAKGGLELVTPEQEVWRVEASRGRCFEPGVYELTRDNGAEPRWRLVQVGDRARERAEAGRKR